jgi:hypothetical protein
VFLFLVGFKCTYYFSPYVIEKYSNEYSDYSYAIIYPYIYFCFSLVSMFVGQLLIKSELYVETTKSNLIWLVTFLCVLGATALNMPEWINYFDAIYLSFSFAFVLQVAYSLFKVYR